MPEYLAGGGFDGANCNKLLKHLDNLEETVLSHSYSLLPITECLRDFKRVVDECFSSQLGESLVPSMVKLKNSFDYLIFMSDELNCKKKISITWKIHILFEHVVPFCIQTKRGLALFAEQTGESVHCKFKPTWARYKRDHSHMDHGDSLLRAISNFSYKRR